MTLTYSSYRKLGRGADAPQFILPGVDGKKHKLTDFEKPVLIIFMCNHCPYVVPKFDYFSELADKYPEIAVIGINSNDAKNYPEDSFEKMREYADKHNFKFTYLFDESQEVAKAYGAECTPDPFLFDKEHKLVYHGRFDDAHGKGHYEGNTSEMEDAIQQMLKADDITVETLPSCGCNIKWK